MLPRVAPGVIYRPYITKIVFFVAHRSEKGAYIVPDSPVCGSTGGAWDDEVDARDPRGRPAGNPTTEREGKRMNVAGARHAVRARLLPLCVLLLVCVTAPMELTAQTKADRESVNRVVESLFVSAGDLGDEVAPLPGVWSVVIARFAKGDSREIEIRVTVDEWYSVVGVSEAVGTDVDICVYGPGGVRIDCDTLDDNVPIVSFSAETDGVYRAVMTAASVEGGGLSYAGMIVLRILDEGAGDEGGGR